jgi:hypothetical protein
MGIKPMAENNKPSSSGSTVHMPDYSLRHRREHRQGHRKGIDKSEGSMESVQQVVMDSPRTSRSPIG